MHGQDTTNGHRAYLDRKLDLKERELTIREREIAVDEARVALDREKYEWVKAQQADRSSHMDGLREMFEHIASHADDDEPMVSPNSRGRA